jgi:hypothetical protein
LQKAPHILALALAILCVLSPAIVAQEVHHCAACGQAISGAYFETKGRFYHPEHFLCAYCGEPIKSAYTTYRGENYHSRCFEEHVALRCAICGGVVQGQYIIDFWGNAYHMRHKGEVPACDFCMRFITDELYDGSIRYSDGRILCRICAKSAVKKIGGARAIMRQVADHLRRFGIDVDTDRVQLHLIGLKQMQLLVHKPAHGLRGFADYQEERNLIGIRRRQQVDIYVLYGAPRIEMAATLAHELTHVWQFFNGSLEADPALSEGSCNYAAYLTLRKLGGPESEFIMQRMIDDDDPVYGGGFRRVKRYAEENGLANWLVLLRKNQSLPQYSQR